MTRRMPPAPAGTCQGFSSQRALALPATRLRSSSSSEQAQHALQGRALLVHACRVPCSIGRRAELGWNLTTACKHPKRRGPAPAPGCAAPLRHDSFFVTHLTRRRKHLLCRSCMHAARRQHAPMALMPQLTCNATVQVTAAHQMFGQGLDRQVGQRWHAAGARLRRGGVARRLQLHVCGRYSIATAAQAGS